MLITRISKYSWFKIQSGGVTIHIDPGYAGYYQSQGFDEGLFDDKADIVLITHHHKDHLQPMAIDKICHDQTKIYATSLCKKLLNRPYQVVQPGFVDNYHGIKIQVVAAYNTAEGNSTRKPHHPGECVGYVIEIDGRRIYHAGDTDLIPEMSALGEIDIAFIPIGGTFTMDFAEALRAVEMIKPNLVIPMHCLKTDPQEFLKRLSAVSKSSGRYLQPGDKYNIEAL